MEKDIEAYFEGIAQELKAVNHTATNPRFFTIEDFYKRGKAAIKEIDYALVINFVDSDYRTQTAGNTDNIRKIYRVQLFLVKKIAPEAQDKIRACMAESEQIADQILARAKQDFDYGIPGDICKYILWQTSKMQRIEGTAQHPDAFGRQIDLIYSLPYSPIIDIDFWA